MTPPDEDTKRRTLWEGRLASPMSERVRSYTSSLDVDLRLLPDDIEASLAHAAMLHDVGLLDGDASQAIASGLQRILAECDAGAFAVSPDDEDVHSAVERRLHELVGEPALRLHTGRSRNDQVATDIRLYTRRTVAALLDGIDSLLSTLQRVAEQHEHTAMPGYTHLQRAQPVTLSRHLLAYAAMLQRDAARFGDALRRADELPLGAGALAGSTLPLDPANVARRLGFSRVAANSMDAVSDRDVVAEVVFACALLMVHCSRMCEDFVLWCSAEFGFMSPGDAQATGSSLMPQKKNPDVAELGRGRAARVIADCVTALTMLKGLPLTYDRDLQEDKRALFDALDVSADTVGVLAEFIDTARFNAGRMRAAASDPLLLATDVAEHLVRGGVPFREAHRIVAEMVRRVEAEQRSLTDVSEAEWEAVAPGAASGITGLFDLDAALRRRGM
ncbi:MAG: argininosuccinate lyase [Candidatus Dormibacteraeota bacterium]|nr:argininosuccinate lyase [Candidatus Dormibacteraeota bacterium]